MERFEISTGGEYQSTCTYSDSSDLETNVQTSPEVQNFHLLRWCSVKPQDVGERLWDRTDFGEKKV